MFNLLDIEYMKQSTVEESKLAFINQCLYDLIKKKQNISRLKYDTEVLIFKKHLPSIIDNKLIEPKLLKYFNAVYRESEKIN